MSQLSLNNTGSCHNHLSFCRWLMLTDPQMLGLGEFWVGKCMHSVLYVIVTAVDLASVCTVHNLLLTTSYFVHQLFSELFYIRLCYFKSWQTFVSCHIYLCISFRTYPAKHISQIISRAYVYLCSSSNFSCVQVYSLQVYKSCWK